MLMVVSVFSWGLFSVFSRKALQNLPRAGHALRSFLRLVICFYSFSFSGGIGEIAGISATGWGNILFLGVFCSALAYLFSTTHRKELQASEVGVFLYVNPVVAVLISALFLGESISVSMVAGGILVFLGVWFVNSGKINSAVWILIFIQRSENRKMKIISSASRFDDISVGGATAVYVLSGETIPEGFPEGTAREMADGLDERQILPGKGRIVRIPACCTRFYISLPGGPGDRASTQRIMFVRELPSWNLTMPSRRRIQNLSTSSGDAL